MSRAVRLYSERPTSAEKFNGKQRVPVLNWGCVLPLSLAICMLVAVIGGLIK